MSLRTWKGGTAAIAQVWKGSITTTTTGHTYIATFTDLDIGGTVAFSYALVAGDSSTTIAAASWVAAFNNSTLALVSNITATSSLAVITLTAKIAGQPFSVATSGTGTWASTGNTTNSSSPNDLNIDANYVENVAPTSGDDVIVQGSNNLTYNLAQASNWTANVSFAGFTGTTGRFGAPLVIAPTGFAFNASGKAYVDIGASAIAPRVTGTAGGGTGTYGLMLLGSAITTLKIEGGNVGLAPYLGQTATAATIDLSNSATAFVGIGVTLTTFNQASGIGTIECAATTVSVDAGTLTTNGTGAITTFNCGNAIGGPNVTPNSTGTITTFNAKGGTADFTQNHAARTVTTLNIYNGAKVIRDPAIITVTTLAQSDASALTAA